MTTTTTTTTTCAARHPGACDTIVGRANIVATLEAHGVQTRVIGTTAGVLVEAWEEATVDGVDVSQWVVAPVTLHALAAWLGY